MMRLRRRGGGEKRRAQGTREQVQRGLHEKKKKKNTKGEGGRLGAEGENPSNQKKV